MVFETTQIPLKGNFSWAASPEAKALIEALGENQMRFVGGAVRDSLLGKEVLDIDVATSLDPESVMKKLAAGNFKVVPTGLKHGTVTAIINHKTFEVTTLRHDVETFGRHANVEFHDDWRADARRRDFTINALYLDADGRFYDFFNGFADLKSETIRFIGDAQKRIEEDGLRILRLFRFHAWYGKGPVDPEALNAARQKIDLLDQLSAERVGQEILKTLRAENPVSEFETMQEIGILEQIFPGFDSNFPGFKTLVSLETKLEMISSIRRLGSLFRGQGKVLSKCLKLSNKQKDRLLKMETNPLPDPLTDKAIRADIYLIGREAFVDRLLLLDKNLKEIKTALKISTEFSLPKFPVTGKDMEAIGMAPGIEMGVKLKGLEKRWLESDFKLTKIDLLKD